MNGWGLVQYRIGAESAVGVLTGEEIRAAPSGWPADTVALLESWSEWSRRTHELDVDALNVVTGARLLAPITYPRKLICAGANFYDHAEEMGTARPDSGAEPFFFLKPPTTAIVGPDTTVSIPALEKAELDWEIELAVIIGRGGRDISTSSAADHIAGYTVANDLSARGLFPRPDAVLAPFAWDWLRHKAFDGSCPLGPALVPSWLVADPQSLGMSLTVNGEVRQDSSAKQMVIPVDELVAAASRTVTLEPGDVILTGTPAGVGMPTREFLHSGDVVEATIEGLGTLRTTVIDADRKG